MTKENEESLSEKRMESETSHGYYNYCEEDIKEFIKRLKKVCYGKDGFATESMHKKIDKLAGDDLI